MALQKYKNVVIILMASLLQITLQESMDCVLEEFPKTRTFSSLEEYQRTRISFNPHHFGYQGNVVAFSAEKLEVIPKNAFISFGSEGIVELKLDHKQIRKIDAGAFFELDCLNELNLGFNNLTDITGGTFEGLGRLKNLLLNDNLLETTPDGGMAFLHLKSLKILNLSRNRIKTVQSIAFHSLKNLEVLNLGYNRIRFIDDTVFNPLVNLEILLLNNNYLTTIAPHRWEDLGKLTVLDLANNFLTNFDAGYNFSFSNLTKLNLSSNALTVLDGTGLKEHLKNLEQLDIGNNFWTCPNLNAFRSAIYGSKMQIPRGIKCSNKEHINWSIPKPPPEDLEDPIKNSTVNFLDSIRKNISNQINHEFDTGNKRIMVRLSYIQNILTFLSGITIMCFLLMIIVKLQACQVITNSFGQRQSDFGNRRYTSSNTSEMYRLIRR